MEIRKFEERDFKQIWPIILDIITGQETYAFDPQMTEQEAYAIWITAPTATYVFENNKKIIGTYYIKPNAGGPGSHVCNCGYMVSKEARGMGVASRMCEHSIKIAKEIGFKAMQFNSVVSVNTVAIKLWEKFGFKIVGTLPNAYDHKKSGLVDAYIMYKWLR